MNKVGIYIRTANRVSNNEGHSDIIMQRNIIQEFCSQNKNFTIYKEYIDNGFSGLDFNRPGFKCLLNDIKQKKINCLIVADLSRLGRAYYDVQYYVENYFFKYNIRFIAVNSGYDSNAKYNIHNQ
jgi:DNA invertase Pin-like site-specific DNA recombinase